MSLGIYVDAAYINVNSDHMAVKKRRSAGAYHHGNLRAALIAAGARILARDGWEAMSLRTVAKAAGVSPAAPYRHFENAAALAAAIAEQGFFALKASMEAGLADPLLVELSTIERIGHGYARFALAHPDHLRLMFAGVPGAGAEWAATLAAGEGAFGVLMGVIMEGQAAGRVAPGAPHVVALAAWSIIHGLSVLLIEERIDPARFGFGSVSELITACQRVFRHGWQSTP